MRVMLLLVFVGLIGGSYLYVRQLSLKYKEKQLALEQLLEAERNQKALVPDPGIGKDLNQLRVQRNSEARAVEILDQKLRMEQALLRNSDDLGSLKIDIAGKKRNLDDLKNQQNSIANQIRNLDRNTNLQQKATQSADRAAVSNQVASINYEIKAENDSIADLNNQLSQLRSLGRLQDRAAVQQVLSQIQGHHQRVLQLKADREAVRSNPDGDSHQANLARQAQIDRQALLDQQEDIQRQYDAAKSDYDSYASHVGDESSQQAEESKRIKAMQDELAQHKQLLSTLNSEIEAKQNELTLSGKPNSP